MSLSASDLEARLAAHQAAADEAWDEWQRETNLAAWCYDQLNRERQHQKRLSAVDEALRKAD